jgi:hypothetical protein
MINQELIKRTSLCSAKLLTRPTRYFWILMATGILALSSSYAALVVRSASWAETRRLSAIYSNDESLIRPFSHDGMPIRSFGPATWQQAQDLLAAGALLAVVA